MNALFIRGRLMKELKQLPHIMSDLSATGLLSVIFPFHILNINTPNVRLHLTATVRTSHCVVVVWHTKFCIGPVVLHDFCYHGRL